VLDVRFGSEADISFGPTDVRFTAKGRATAAVPYSFSFLPFGAYRIGIGWLRAAEQFADHKAVAALRDHPAPFTRPPFAQQLQQRWNLRDIL
jgi:hypothetical protein